MSFASIEALLTGESPRIDWKQNADATDILQAVCALANDLEDSKQPGYLILGVDKHGRPVGVTDKSGKPLALSGTAMDERQQQLASRILSIKLMPQPSLHFDAHEVEGKTLLRITIEPYPVPPVVKVDGVAYVRVGTTTRKATEADLLKLGERRPLHRQPFDLRPVAGAQLDDLSRFELSPRYDTAKSEVDDPESFPSLTRWLVQKNLGRGIDADFCPTAAALLVLFNNKGGVGKTTLTFHLAHMLARLGLRVVAIDYDPQCNLTAAMLDMAALVDVWGLPEDLGSTVSACLEPVRRGRGELRAPRLQEIADRLWLLPGHLSLSRFEQVLAENWPKTMASDNERALDVVLSLSALAHKAAESVAADVVLCDVGPSLGALNRAALLACDFVAVPLALDLFSLQALLNVGPTLVEWRTDWQTVGEHHIRSHPFASYTGHRFVPIGYIVQQLTAKLLTAGDHNWASAIARTYLHSVMAERLGSLPWNWTIDSDPRCIAQVRHFSQLTQLSQHAYKPMFDLKQADGVVGGQIYAVQECKRTFERLAKEICRRMDVRLPEATA